MTSVYPNIVIPRLLLALKNTKAMGQGYSQALSKSKIVIVIQDQIIQFQIEMPN